MSLSLRPHPSTSGPADLSLEASVWRDGGGDLAFVFELKGDIWSLAIPTPIRPVRADGLWEHTCMEAFVRADGDAGYFEFNVSPGGEWAAYSFDAYREGMRAADVAAPFVDRENDAQSMLISGKFHIPALAAAPIWRVGLSAVIETREGAITYWALTHAPDKPDFHDPKSFTLNLPRPEQP